MSETKLRTTTCSWNDPAQSAGITAPVGDDGPKTPPWARRSPCRSNGPLVYEAGEEELMMPEKKRKTLTEQYRESSEANEFLAAHCSKTLKDIYKGYQGISHTVNRCLAENADLWKSLKEFCALHDSSKKRQVEAEAEIGRLRERVALLEEAVEKSRTAYAELRGKIGK